MIVEVVVVLVLKELRPGDADALGDFIILVILSLSPFACVTGMILGGNEREIERERERESDKVNVVASVCLASW